MPLKIAGASTGSVTLAAPATGSDVTLTLPGSAGTAALTTDTGLAFITSSTFSAVASVSVNNCFTSTYANYRILLNVDSISTAASIDLRLRASGSDNASSNYYFNGPRFDTSSETAPTAARSNGLTTYFRLLVSTNGVALTYADVWNPERTALTAITSTSIFQNATDMGSYHVNGRMSVTTSYDGFTILPSAGNVTGTVRVYGYRN